MPKHSWGIFIFKHPRYIKIQEQWSLNPDGKQSPLLALTPSINHVSVRLTDERWHHILAGHPEVERDLFTILEIIESPRFVLYCQEDNFFVAGRQIPLEGRSSPFLIARSKEINRTDGLIISAYFVHREKIRRRYQDCEQVYPG